MGLSKIFDKALAVGEGLIKGGGNPIKMVTNAIAAVTGIEVDDVADYTPEQLKEIKLKELEVEEEMERQAVILRQSQLADVQDARSKRDTEGPLKWFLPGLTVLVFVTFGLIMWSVITKDVPTESREIVYMLAGVMQTIVVMVMSFWYGSSQGSKAKDQK